MDTSDAIQLLVVIVLIGLSAFFSSGETALVTVNRLRLEGMAENGDRRARTVLKVIENSGKMLSTILIGNNIVNLSASSLMTSWTIRVFGNAYVGLGTGILTLLILLFGEISPKTLATHHAENIALVYAPIILFLMRVLTPVIFIINKLSSFLMFLFHVDPNQKSAPMTEHELRSLVNEGHKDGVIETEEREMIYNVFDFNDSEAKDIMVPRIDMIFVNVNDTYDELIASFRENGYTRLPVYEDTTDTVIGIINMKDLLLIDRTDDFSVRNILREPYFTYEHKNISSLMMDMREKSIYFAIVLDEYGATAGLITLEDLLEEIVGEIRDEYDEEEDEFLTEIIPGREYTAVGSAKLDDINDELGTELESEDYDSIGGFIIGQLDRLPEEHASVTLDNGIQLCVDKVEKNRIELVHIYLPEKDDEPGEDE